jgi:glycine cleavage system aminomethyltransferase T
VDDNTSASGEKRYMLGHEPICRADGTVLQDRNGRRSFVTVAASGPSVGRHLLMAYLPVEDAVVGNRLAVEYIGELYPVTVAAVGSTAVFDPENARMRG